MEAASEPEMRVAVKGTRAKREVSLRFFLQIQLAQGRDFGVLL
jgi:hypothetical protein